MYLDVKTQAQNNKRSVEYFYASLFKLFIILFKGIHDITIDVNNTSIPMLEKLYTREYIQTLHPSGANSLKIKLLTQH